MSIVSYEMHSCVRIGRSIGSDTSSPKYITYGRFMKVFLSTCHANRLSSYFILGGGDHGQAFWSRASARGSRSTVMSKTEMQSAGSSEDLSLSSYAAARRLAAGLLDDEEDENEPEDQPRSSDIAGRRASVPGYLISGVLGEGSGGVVYEGFREGSDRPVAIKIMRADLSDEVSMRRVWRELHMQSELRLDCLPRVLDYGEVEGRLYIVTERIDGRSLETFVEERNLDRAARVQLLAEIARAVQQLHDHGVIHRDLKPENILIDQFGKPVILDLGIAMLLVEDVRATLSDESGPMGSPAFMAPEQARGERHLISVRSDVYALGAIGFQLILGTTPHATDAPLHEVVRRVSQDTPRDPRAIEPKLPRPLAAVLAKAVAPQPDDRYPSAGAFADDLDRWRRREPVMATPPSLVRRVGRILAQHPFVSSVSVGVLIAAAIVVGTAASLHMMNSRPHQVILDPEAQSFLRLVSLSGQTLHLWETGRADGIRSYADVRSQAIPETRGVFIAFADQADLPWAGDACLFSYDQPDEPLWCAGRDHPPLKLPPGLTALPDNRRFQARMVRLATVFPERDHPQLMSVHYYGDYSPTAIRIHDIHGELLYEAWHGGRITDVLWMPEAEQLLVTGYNNEATFADRGFDYTERFWPMVVLATRPELNQRTGYCRETGRELTWQESKLERLWCRMVIPPETQLRIGSHMSLRLISADTDHESAGVGFHEHRRSGRLLTLIINRDGEVLDREVSDRYIFTDHTRPDPKIIELIDLPPILREPSYAPLDRNAEDSMDEENIG
ncbi:MAG: serine/threonine protein kinase [Phycisphaerales bacterium]|nr:MAG: serine/threonine protein kinase [Phycisphaerales bacterium]